MVAVALWVGRMVILALLVLYLWALAGRVRRSGAAEAVMDAPFLPGRGLPARLALVQDNAVEGVRLAGETVRVQLRQEVPLGEEVTLGRDPGNTVVVGDRFTSARHARVFRRDGAYWVEDLGSRNGTLLNGHRVSGAQRLLAGDRITVGSCTFKFMG